MSFNMIPILTSITNNAAVKKSSKINDEFVEWNL